MGDALVARRIATGEEADPKDALPATAEGIANLFCRPGMASACRERSRDEEARTSSRGGFAGYPVVDDGYSLMARLPNAWRPLAECGDWPYAVYWANVGELAVLSYCEGDLEVSVADDHEAFLALVARLRREVPAP